MQKIDSGNAFYIKLGEGGQWEPKNSITSQTMAFQQNAQAD